MNKNLRRKRFTQLFLIHVIAQTWYIFTFVFIHKSLEFIALMVTALFSNFLFLLLFKKTGNYERYGGLIYLMGTVFLAFLVYLGGGAKAPAVFSFALIPMACAFFFEAKYLKPSFIWSLILLTIVVAMAESFPPSELNLDYEQHKLMNTVFFIIAFFACVSSFLQTIESKDKEIKKQKDDIQNLLRIVIHDISSPLTVAITRTSILARENPEPKGIEVIQRSLNTITNIIGDVKRLEQISQGKLKLNQDKINLKGMCEEIHSEVETLLENKELKLEIKCSSSLNMVGDYSLLKNNVLMNIITNAIKFSNRGETVELNIVMENELVISVIDYGDGIPPEILSVIFSPHNHTTRVGTNGEKGTGFGLPIVKKLIVLMNGKIAIESNYPRKAGELGTKVELRFNNNLKKT